MAKKTTEAPKERESIKTAKALRMAAMEKDQFELLQKMLAPFGVKYETQNVRSNVYDGGKTPFAIKVKTNSFTFLVSVD